MGALVLGGAAVAASLGGAGAVLAVDPSASPSPAAATAPSTGGPGDHGRGGFLGPNHEAVSDTSVAAKAIGITEAQLTTALQSGQTIAAVAKAHNVDAQKVIDALVADANDEIATALKNGTITQAQADAEKAEVTARVTAQVNGTFGPGGPGDHGRGGFLGPNHEAVSDTSVAAKAIGITEAQLTTALQSGQTIAAVAKAHNVDAQKVIDALVADANDEIATALKNGTITQAQADAEKAEVTARVTAQVNGTFGPGGPGDHGRGGWPPAQIAPSA